MSGHHRFVLCFLLLAMLAPAFCFSVPLTLFTEVGPQDPDNLPPPGVNAIYPVNVDRAALAGAPMEVEIELPGFGTVTATQVSFRPAEGFDENGDPIPGIPASELNFAWTGTTAGGMTVTLTAYEECLAGTFLGEGQSFSLMLAPGATTPALQGTMTYDHALEDLGVPPVPIDGEEPPPALLPPAAWSYRSGYGPAVADSDLAQSPPPGLIFDPMYVYQVDLLTVFPESVRVAAGGNPEDETDTVHAACLARHSVTDINATLANSGITDFYVLSVGELLVPGFEPTGPVFDVLFQVKERQEIMDLRDAVGADAVSFLGRSWAQLVACGRAFTQRHGCGDDGPLGDCDVGPAFNDWAYNVIAYDCVKYQVGAHEFGHNLGAEHQFSAAVPRDRASFYFSYGHIFPSTPQYETIMVNGWDYERLLTFSSPYIYHDGSPTGELGLSFNALTVEYFLAVVATFRAPLPFLIFRNGFETGDTALWPESP